MNQTALLKAKYLDEISVSALRYPTGQIKVKGNDNISLCYDTEYQKKGSNLADNFTRFQNIGNIDLAET